VVEDGTRGAPAVLLLQNAAAPIALWDPLVPLLAGGYRVIRVDLIGHGRSGPVAGYGVPAQARRAGVVLDKLGAGRVMVIGHSSGGYVATAVAEQRPGTVAALALIDKRIPAEPFVAQARAHRRRGDCSADASTRVRSEECS
jgi:pimeloyl-ACP methyl ester carboxylesterase